MRRYVFYLAVALLAFGVGSVVVFKVYWITEEKPDHREEANVTTQIQPEQISGTGFGVGSSERRLNEPVYVPKLHKPTCHDRKIIPIWNELKKDEVFKEREEEFYQTGDCRELIEIDRIDLNNDGQKEFIIWGRYTFSGATGNCVIWIYEKKNGQYKQILQSNAYKNGDEEQWFEVRKTKTNGYRSILLKVHASGYETIEQYYEFDGNQYNEVKCLFLSYFPDENNPSIMTCKEAWEK